MIVCCYVGSIMYNRHIGRPHACKGRLVGNQYGHCKLMDKLILGLVSTQRIVVQVGVNWQCLFGYGNFCALVVMGLERRLFCTSLCLQ